MAKREKSEYDVIKSVKRLLFSITYITPVIYTVVFLILQLKIRPYTPNYYFFLLSTEMRFIILLLSLATLLIIPLSYKFLIPYIKKLNDDSGVPFLLIFLNSLAMLVSTFGLLIGQFGYLKHYIVDWFTILPFIIVGTSYGIYLKIKIIPPIFKRYEILTLRHSQNEN